MSAGSVTADPIAVAPIRTSSPCGVIGCGHRPGTHVLLDTGGVACSERLRRLRRDERRVQDWERTNVSATPRPRVHRVEPRHAFSFETRELVRRRDA